MLLSDKHAEALVATLREKGDGLSLSAAKKIEELSCSLDSFMGIAESWGNKNTELRRRLYALGEKISQEPEGL